MTQDGQVMDSTILDTGEIELVDVKVDAAQKRLANLPPLQLSR